MVANARTESNNVVPDTAETDLEAGGKIQSGMATEKFGREATAITELLEKLDGQLESAMERVDENERTKRVLAHAKTKSVAVQRRLVRIADENKKMTSSIVADKGKYSASEVRIRLNTSQELVRRYMQTTQLIEKVEEMQKERETSAILGELHTLNPHATESELERAMEQNDFSRVLLVDQLDGRKADIARRVEDLTSRNAELKALETDMLELNQIHIDMSILVQNQGELFKQLEFNTAETKKHATTGVEEVSEARDIQKSIRKKKIILFCVVAAIILIIVIIIIATTV